MPRIKKPGLIAADVKSYRPISNLSVISKLLERVIVQQLYNYLTSSDLLPSLQSGFQAHHSAETAMLQVLSDILLAVDRGDLAALVLLDLSAAFDRSTMPFYCSVSQSHLASVVSLTNGSSPTCLTALSVSTMD